MKKHDHEQMLGLYNEWQASGESKTDFAVSKGIRPTTFYYWTRKFEKLCPVAPSGFRRIPLEDTYHNSQGGLMAAIHYPCGTRLELYSSFQHLDSSYVQLLKTLAQ
jgi:hypothetical protein